MGSWLSHAQGWQISTAHNLKSTKDTELKFLVCWSIMLHNILKSLGKFGKGRAGTFFKISTFGME